MCIDTATGCYNEVYREPGERVAVVNGESRSSLVTSPADGQVPDLTPTGQERVDARRDFREQFGPQDHPSSCLWPSVASCRLALTPVRR